MTHFACADQPGEDDFTLEQIARFMEVARAAEELGFKDFIRHAANTAEAIRFPAARLDMVRVGIGLYGVYPSPKRRTRSTSRLWWRWSARSSKSKTCPRAIVSATEGLTGCRRGRRVAVVAAGYHDCVPRGLSNFGYRLCRWPQVPHPGHSVHGLDGRGCQRLPKRGGRQRCADLRSPRGVDRPHRGSGSGNGHDPL